MKKRFFLLNISLIVILTLLFINSCTAEQELGGGGIGDDNKDKFTISLSLTQRSSAVRATEPGDDDGSYNENKISTIDAFFYEGSTLKLKVVSSELTYDDDENLVTIPVKTDKRALFIDNTTQSYDLYIVANNTADLSSIREEEDNLTELKNLIIQSDDFAVRGGLTAQSNFVMDGNIQKVINLSESHLGTVDMKRAASKIRLRLLEVDVPGYIQDGNAQAQLIHFTGKSALIDGGVFTPESGDWHDVAAREMDVESTYEGGLTTSAPFYAYANNWEDDETKETYLQLLVPLKKEDTGTTKFYRYRVPITPRDLAGDQAQYMNKLHRNFLYDISVVIKVIGSVYELPVEVSGNYLIKDWSTHEVLVEIKEAHYLAVSETDVIMPNVSSYTLTFNSSIADVKLVPNSLEASYTYVKAADAEPTKENITTGDQMPSVMVESNTAAGTITITSKIPENYIPKDIKFEITNGKLTETVRIKQLPETYFEVIKGTGSFVPTGSNPNSGETRTRLPGNNKNPYIYSVTTLAPTGDIIWGFPPVDANGYTLDDEDVSKMVSPKFEMASQFGASNPKSYNNAKVQCQGYWEKTEDGTIKRGWRLPTAAEIKYIDDLQHSGNAQQNIGIIMAGRYYWSSWSEYISGYDYRGRPIVGAYKMKNSNTNVSSSNTNAHVRCIRDIRD